MSTRPKLPVGPRLHVVLQCTEGTLIAVDAPPWIPYIEIAHYPSSASSADYGNLDYRYEPRHRRFKRTAEKDIEGRPIYAEITEP